MKYKMTMRGKIVILALTVCFIVTGLKICRRNPDSLPVQNIPSETTSEPSTLPTTSIRVTDASTETTAPIPQLKLSGCSSAILYCPERDDILFSQDADKSVAPASITKLLTACTALTYLDSDICCEVGTEQLLVQPDSSLCYLSQGQQLTVKDLITGMLMASGNDAAYTLAVNTVRNLYPDIYMTDYQYVEKFCDLMNSFAADIGMKNSHFCTPDGWDNNDQYTTASDLVILARYAMTVPEIRDAAGCSEQQVTIESGENFIWHNSNKLIDPQSEFYCKNAFGLKTGSTVAAGNCLISTFEVQGLTYIVIVTGCNTDSERYSITLRLINEYT